VVVDLAELGCLGVVGSASATDRLIAGLVGQLCTTHPPHELAVSVASSGPHWSWAARLPHAAELSLGSPGADADPRPDARSRPARAGPLLVLVVPRPGPGTGELVQTALAGGVVVVAAAPSRPELPAGCRAVVHREDGRHVLDGPAGPVAFVPDLVGAWWTDRVSRALAPLRCSAPSTGARMPSRLTLVDALGVEEVTAPWVADRWVAGERPPGATTTLAAVVGAGPRGPFVIDLCRDGPHVLVGGTTGSGKSEFLRTLVTSLALSSPPEEVTFVLVDFKGGAAFGPCAALPHVVGLVTDLDDHLVSRALASLRAELRRRERLLAAVGASDLEAYRRLRSPGTEPVPRLVVVVDELRALVEELPDFVTGLVRLAALGRSLGVHLVLATQRPSGAVSAEVRANVSLRIAFRVRDRADSVDVLDDGSAAGIAPSTPGRAMVRGADGALVTFQAATVTTPRARDTGLRVRSSPIDDGLDDGSRRGGEAMDGAARALVETVRDAHRLVGGQRPRAPWLAPLPAIVPVIVPDGPSSTDALPVVGQVDQPDLQRVTPLGWDADDGPWLLAGGSGSGRTTALRSLALAAARCGPGAVHLHVIDTHGSLADLEALPHLGTRAGIDDERACAALVRHLRDVVDRRLGAPTAPSSTPRPGRPTTLVLVDGWDQLVEAQPAHRPDQLTGALLRVLRDGRSVGVSGAVSGGRSLLHPRWGEVGARTFLMGRIDPLEAALSGLRAADVPHDPPPGRAVRVHDTREVQFFRATPDDTAAVADGAVPRPTEGAAWRWVPLPAVVHRAEVPRGARTSTGGDADHGGDVLLGVGGDHGGACWWRPGTDGRRLLVVGPARSGRTNALRVIAQSRCTTGQLVVVVSSAGDVRRMPWPLGCVIVDPNDTEGLVRLRSRHPDLALCVDDTDRLGDSDLVPVLREIIGLVDRDGGLAVLSTSSTALATRFSGIEVELARHGCGLVLSPTPADRDLLSVPMPDGIPRHPGRGAFVTRGEVTEVQLLLAEGSVGKVAPREHLGLGVASHPRRPDGHDRHPDDDPADGDPSALDQADADRHEDHVPGQGRGARP
jgi:S-DNA-T family DNA segregation ATPase FtsK/SpoIIIE